MFFLGKNNFFIEKSADFKNELSVLEILISGASVKIAVSLYNYF